MEKQLINKLDYLKLEKILEVENEDVICRFMDTYDIDEIEAKKIFQETKKWMWLCVESKKNTKFNFFIDDSLLIIDEMWHNFILFTKDYADFCNQYFGYYVHHQLTTKFEKENWKDNFIEKIELHKKNLKTQYEYIYDFLGEKTLLIWYKDFAEKYTKEYLKKITK
jgi:hypothetical protein